MEMVRKVGQMSGVWPTTCMQTGPTAQGVRAICVRQGCTCVEASQCKALLVRMHAVRMYAIERAARLAPEAAVALRRKC